MRITAGLLLLAALGAGPLQAAAEDAPLVRAWQFKPAAAASLKVENFHGEVRIERGGEGFHVTATVRVDIADPSESARLARAVEFRTHDVGPGSRFEVAFPEEDFPKLYYPEGPRHWWLGVANTRYLGEKRRLSGDPKEAPPVRVDLVVRAPAGAALELKNRFGSIRALGHEGRLSLDTGRGEVQVEGGKGKLVLDTGSGSVEVSNYEGELSADTGSGAVRISGCRCELRIDTGSGETLIRGGAGSLYADTGSGAVRVEGFNGPIRADTGSGRVEARGVSGLTELGIDTGSGSVSIEGDLSALRRLGIDTGSGGVELRSSAMPSLRIAVESGSGGVDVDAPGATIEQRDRREWTVTMGEGEGRGSIETSSGSVRVVVRPPAG